MQMEKRRREEEEAAYRKVNEHNFRLGGDPDDPFTKTGATGDAEGVVVDDDEVRPISLLLLRVR